MDNKSQAMVDRKARPGRPIRLLLLNDSREGGGAESVYNATFDLVADDERFVVDRMDRNDVGSRHFLFGQKAWNVQAARALSDRCEKFFPDVIWIHNFHGFLSGSIFRAIAAYKQRTGCRVLMTMHDFQLVGFNPTLLYYKGRESRGSVPLHHLGLRAWTYKSTHKPIWVDMLRKTYWTIVRRVANWSHVLDAVLCPSPFMQDLALNNGLPRPILLRQPSFVESSVRTTKQAGNGRGLRLLCIGRLSREKGVSHFLALVDRLGFAGVDRIDIVGGGEEAASIRDWVVRQGREDKVFCHGLLPRDDALKYIAYADAIVVASLWYENAPMVIVEAAALGTPSLVRAYGSLETFANDIGSKVLWYDDGTTHALRDALSRLQRLVDDPAAIDVDAYSPERYLDSVSEVIESLRESA